MQYFLQKALIISASLLCFNAAQANIINLNDGDVATGIKSGDIINLNGVLTATDNMVTYGLQFDDPGWTATLTAPTEFNLFAAFSSQPDLGGTFFAGVPNDGALAGQSVTFTLNAGLMVDYLTIGYVQDPATASIINTVYGGTLSLGVPSNGGAGFVSGYPGTPSAVPVPAALPLMASAIGIFGLARKQKKR